MTGDTAPESDRLAPSSTTRRDGSTVDLPEVLRQLDRLRSDPLVGLLDGSSAAGDPGSGSLRTAVVLAELRRRLGRRAVQLLVFDEMPADPGLEGEPALPLLPWEALRADAVSSRLSAVLVLNNGESTPLVGQVIDGLTESGCLVETIACDSPLVDPLLLAGRLWGADERRVRRDYLRLSGALPAEGGYVLCDPEHRRSDRTATAVDTLARGEGLSVVYPADGAAPLDLVALVDEARLVVAGSPSMAALATGLGRPTIALGPEPAGIPSGAEETRWGLPRADPDRLVEIARRCLAGLDHSAGDRDRRTQLELAAGIDVIIDHAVSGLVESRNHRVREVAAQQVKALIDRTEQLEVANVALQERLARERLAMAAYVHDRWDEARPAAELGACPPVVGPEPSTPAGDRLEEAETEVRRLRAEIDRIYATRTMRTLQPARALYARLRSTIR